MVSWWNEHIQISFTYAGTVLEGDTQRGILIGGGNIRKQRLFFFFFKISFIFWREKEGTHVGDGTLS